MLNKIKSSAVKAGSKIKQKASQVNNFFVRRRWRIFKIVVVLSLIALVTSLVMSAIKGVRIIDQGVIINHTQQRIIEGSYTNQQVLTGLGSTIFAVPRQKFLIYFGSQKPAIDTKYISDAINARVVQGTKIQVQARVSCRISVTSLSQFLQEYGLDWHKYIINKIKNSIIQRIAVTKFYDLNNTLLISELNQQYTQYFALSISNVYPFQVSFINLRLSYPQSMQGNNTNSQTMGMDLILRNSEYTQLYNHYTSLNQKIGTTGPELETYSFELGKIEGELMRYQKQLESNLDGWVSGVQELSRVYGDDHQGLREYMWLYFQKMYNSTYNSYQI